MSARYVSSRIGSVLASGWAPGCMLLPLASRLRQYPPIPHHRHSAARHRGLFISPNTEPLRSPNSLSPPVFQFASEKIPAFKPYRLASYWYIQIVLFLQRFRILHHYMSFRLFSISPSFKETREVAWTDHHQPRHKPVRLHDKQVLRNGSISD